MASRGDRYDAPYEARAAAGENVHGEADLVEGYHPRSVLDAGCGTGRVGRELAKRGIEVVGVDLDAEMLATARAKAPGTAWHVADICEVDLGRQFDVVVAAGNVVNFVVPARRRAAVENMARHVASQGRLVVGHSSDGCNPDDVVAWAEAAGLAVEARWSTWERAPYSVGSDYHLVVLVRSSPGA